jgi:N-acetylglucosaminyldiphosphoundecaprenol N-acetyl-beta-D-mannosaminyltransferase
MSKRIELLSLPVDSLTMDETVGLIRGAIENGRVMQHIVVNAAKMVNAQKDFALRQSIVESDIINADGQAVVWASKFLGKPLPERVAGIDLMERLVAMAHENGLKIFFLGAMESVVREVVFKYTLKYSDSIVAGYRNGYFSPEEDGEVALQIAESGAHLLFVAITSPRKEIFLNQYKDVMNIPFVMGVGGSFDVVAGKVSRAPMWMQKSGLEWLYRVYQEPRRMWKRYLITNSLFIFYVLRAKFKSRK